jgi:phosphatidylserine/phosphatidylglycerophosphate/cardiolipin synthase-like enzyme
MGLNPYRVVSAVFSLRLRYNPLSIEREKTMIAKFLNLTVALTALITFSTACTASPPSGPSEYAPTTSADWYTLYFSDPGGPEAETQRGGPDASLAAAIDQAQLSIDAALYDLNLWSIRDALLAAHRRGVSVRIVAESDNLDRPEFQALLGAGIPILGDRGQALMHNKFVVVDGYQVWTGSMNLTLNGAYHNNNNLVRISSTRLAENYTVEFEEMFVDGLFGSLSPANTPHPNITLDRTLIETYFSPDDGAQARIIELIDGAQTSVHFLAFGLTADPIAQALEAAQRRGVAVSGVIESGQVGNAGSDYQYLLNAEIDLRLDGNLRNMHHKVILIDGAIVIFGSYNFSGSAEERNDENLLVVHSIEMAAEFEEEFKLNFENAP